MKTREEIIKEFLQVKILDGMTKVKVDIPGVTKSYMYLKQLLGMFHDFMEQQPEVSEVDRLMKAIIKLHPNLAMDVPEQKELYLAYHACKQSHHPQPTRIGTLKEANEILKREHGDVPYSNAQPISEERIKEMLEHHYVFMVAPSLFSTDYKERMNRLIAAIKELTKH